MRNQLHVVQPVDASLDGSEHTSEPSESKKRSRTVRPYPADSLQDALKIALAIAEHNAGKPFFRVSLAESLGRSPDSSAFRSFITSSAAFGLTKGSYKADLIEMTDLGKEIVWSTSVAEKRSALYTAMTRIPLFASLVEHFKNNRVPDPKLFQNTLIRQFNVDPNTAPEAVNVFLKTGRYVGVIAEVGGKERVLSAEEMRSRLGDQAPQDEDVEKRDFDDRDEDKTGDEAQVPAQTVNRASKSAETTDGSGTRAIFVGHGKNQQALEKLQVLLREFKVPFKVAVNEPNLGRPIPTKVREVMLDCTSGILIFTRDQKFTDEEGNEVWRPSENVVFELGAASFQYEDRVVILKEQGVVFPTNFSSKGYIEFEVESFESKTMEIMRELIGLGLLTVSAA